MYSRYSWNIGKTYTLKACKVKFVKRRHTKTFDKLVMFLSSQTNDASHSSIEYIFNEWFCINYLHTVLIFKINK